MDTSTHDGITFPSVEGATRIIDLFTKYRETLELATETHKLLQKHKADHLSVRGELVALVLFVPTAPVEVAIYQPLPKLETVPDSAPETLSVPGLCPGFPVSPCGKKSGRSGFCLSCAVKKSRADEPQEKKDQRIVNLAAARASIGKKRTATISVEASPVIEREPVTDEVPALPGLPETIPVKLLSGSRRTALQYARSRAINDRECKDSGVFTLYWEFVPVTVTGAGEGAGAWEITHAPERKSETLPEIIEIVEVRGREWFSVTMGAAIGRSVEPDPASGYSEMKGGS